MNGVSNTSTDTTAPTISIGRWSYNQALFEVTDDVGVTEICISSSSTPPSSGWATLESPSGTITMYADGTVYIHVRDAAGNTATASITAYTILPNERMGTTLTTKIGSKTGTTFTEPTVMIKGTTVYVEAKLNEEYADKTLVLTHGETTIGSGETFQVNATEEIVSAIEESVKIKRKDHDTFTWEPAEGFEVKEYCISTSATEPTTGWSTDTKREYDVSKEGTYYVYAKDADENIIKDSISAYTITRSVGEGTTLITKLEGSTGTEFTTKTLAIEGTPIYVKGSLNKESDEETLILKHGETVMKNETKFYVNASETISSSLTKDSTGTMDDTTDDTSDDTTDDTTAPIVTISRYAYNKIAFSAVDDVGVVAVAVGRYPQPIYVNWSPWTETTKMGYCTIDTEGIYYAFAKDAAGNVGKASIVAYAISREQGIGTTLTTKLESSRGDTFTESIAALEGTLIYVKGSLNEGYENLKLKHGSTTMINGTMFTVKANETISSSATSTDTIAPTITVNQLTATPSKKIGITITIADLGGSGLYSQNTYQYYLSSSENTLSDGKWESYISGTEFTIGTGMNGTYYLFVKTIKDEAGNVSTENGTMVEISGTEYHRFGPYEFDNIPPTCTIASSEANSITSSKEITYTIEFNEEVTDFDIEDIEVTNGTKTSFTGSGTTYTLQVSNTTSGEQTITIAKGVCTDAAGNQNESATKTITIDIDGPKIISVEGNPIEWTKENVTLTINAEDTLSGLHETPYSFDGGETWQAENTKTYTENTSGIQIKVRDALENIATHPETIEINKILVLESIAIKSNPDKVNYKVGEKLDTTGLTLELKYNSGSTEEITSGFTCTPENGATLDIAETKEITVTYEGKITSFNVYVTEEKIEITIDSNIYTIDSAYINKIQPSTTFTNLKNNINTTSKTIEVKDKNGNVLGATDIVATGMTLILDENKTYTLVVVGDVNGDGQANLFDILSINKHRLNKTQLNGEYLLAGDVIENSKVDLFDLLQINKFRLKKIQQL